MGESLFKSDVYRGVRDADQMLTDVKDFVKKSNERTVDGVPRLATNASLVFNVRYAMDANVRYATDAGDGGYETIYTRVLEYKSSSVDELLTQVINDNIGYLMELVEQQAENNAMHARAKALKEARDFIEYMG